jgi:hypothetical protein
MDKELEEYMLTVTDEEIEEMFEILKFGHKREE